MKITLKSSQLLPYHTITLLRESGLYGINIDKLDQLNIPVYALEYVFERLRESRTRLILPEAKIAACCILRAGARQLGLHASRYIFLIENILYWRLSYVDIDPDSHRTKGLSQCRDNRLIHFITPLNLPKPQLQALIDQFIESLDMRLGEHS